MMEWMGGCKDNFLKYLVNNFDSYSSPESFMDRDDKKRIVNPIYR